MSPVKTGRKVVAATSGPARRPGLGGRLAGSQEPGRQTPLTADEPESEVDPQQSRRRWSWRGKGGAGADAAGAGGADNAATADWATRGFGALFIACLAAGPVALGVAMTADAPVIVQKAQASGVDAGAVVADSTVAGERGLQTVQLWLASTSQDPKLSEEGLAWPKDATKVSGLRVAAVDQGESGQAWQVTVAAQISGGQRFFAVPVRVEEGAAVAVSMPRATAAPVAAKAPSTDYNQSSIAPTSAMATTLEDFLSAYLGGGDTTRFTSPGTSVPSVIDSEWTTVRVNRVDAHVPSGADATSDSPDEGEKAQVYVEYAMQRGDDRTTAIPSSMALSLTARGGRWEISSIDPAPRMKGSQPSSESSPSPDGASTTSTEGN